MPDWTETDEDDEIPIAPTSVGQAVTEIGDFTASAEPDVKDGRVPAVFQGAFPWSSNDWTADMATITPSQPFQAMRLVWKITDGNGKGMDVTDFISINPLPGKKVTPAGITNNRLEALGWKKSANPQNSAQTVYSGNFKASVGTSVYLDVKNDPTYGLKIAKAHKGDTLSDKLAEEFRD